MRGAEPRCVKQPELHGVADPFARKQVCPICGKRFDRGEPGWSKAYRAWIERR